MPGSASEVSTTGSEVSTTGSGLEESSGDELVRTRMARGEEMLSCRLFIGFSSLEMSIPGYSALEYITEK